MSCKSVLFVSICLLSIVIFVDGVPVNLHRYGSEGDRELINAVRNGNLEYIQSATITSSNPLANLNTLLRLAAEGGNLPTVQYLHGLGADIDGNYLEFVQKFRESGFFGQSLNIYNANTALILAAQSGDLLTVKYLVENGADINAQNAFGGSPLYWSAMFDHFDIVQYLQENGADLNLRDMSQQTALKVAERWDHTQIAEFLRQNGGIL